MTEAFTVRIRTGRGGRFSFWLAPAGGMGLSFPCCDDGHESYATAFLCGSSVLEQKLAPTSLPAAS